LFHLHARPKNRLESIHTSTPSLEAEKLKSVMYGLAIGDALGVPYEFQQRDTFNCTGMIGHGEHNQPAGTWSDDTALSLATLDSFTECHGEVNTADMLMRYRMWLEHGMYMPDGNTFDSGITVATAIRSRHGCDGLDDNGNGSLMRMAPCAFYHLTDMEIEQVSAVTHAHEISLTACVQYVRILEGLLNCVPSHKAITDSGFPFDPTIPRTKVESDGFVLHTLNAALWCLTNTDNYQDCVLTAVNLGEDTDTTASVAGALAGAVYGLDTIPTEWIEKMRGRELIDMYVSESELRC
jgi:ADP-ribosylglycohydrolase